jgi:RNA polymerase sigma factor (sigma-70 family)
MDDEIRNECDRSLKNATHELLERRIREGDDNAVAEMFERHGRSMRHIARGLIGRSMQAHVDATDVVQSVQITIWLGIRAGRFFVPTPEQLLGLARKLLECQVAQEWRKLSAAISGEGNLADNIYDCNFTATTEEADPHDRVEADDLLSRFLVPLDDIDQQLITLRMEGCSTAEVARRLNRDPGFMRVRLIRLRKRFAEFTK